MSDEEQDIEGGEQEDSPETEDIDIEIEPTEPTRGSRGVWFVIVLIIILAALAWYAYWAMQQAREHERQLQAKEARVQQYRMQQRQIGQQLNKGLAKLEDGDVAAVMDAIEKAGQGLSSLVSQAASNEDTNEAARIRVAANQAQKAADELKAKQSELIQLAHEQLTSLQESLGVTPKKLKPPAEEIPKETEETKAKKAPPAPTKVGPGPPGPLGRGGIAPGPPGIPPRPPGPSIGDIGG